MHYAWQNRYLGSSGIYNYIVSNLRTLKLHYNLIMNYNFYIIYCDNNNQSRFEMFPITFLLVKLIIKLLITRFRRYITWYNIMCTYRFVDCSSIILKFEWYPFSVISHLVLCTHWWSRNLHNRMTVQVTVWRWASLKKTDGIIRHRFLMTQLK